MDGHDARDGVVLGIVSFAVAGLIVVLVLAVVLVPVWLLREVVP